MPLKEEYYEEIAAIRQQYVSQKPKEKFEAGDNIGTKRATKKPLRRQSKKSKSRPRSKSRSRERTEVRKNRFERDQKSNRTSSSSPSRSSPSRSSSSSSHRRSQSPAAAYLLYEEMNKELRNALRVIMCFILICFICFIRLIAANQHVFLLLE